jgi:hypothetical protein
MIAFTNGIGALSSRERFLGIIVIIQCGGRGGDNNTLASETLLWWSGRRDYYANEAVDSQATRLTIIRNAEANIGLQHT